MINNKLDSQLLAYIVERELEPGERLPALTELSEEMGVSVGKLREELELARGLGIVSVRPRLGTRREPYSFYPAITTSLMFGLAMGEATFEQFSALRQTIESNMWHQAVPLLTPSDLNQLETLIYQAKIKLRDAPVHIPRSEHRQLHLKIFQHLDNPFVQALLQAYWDAYEMTEHTRFADYSYWLDVWDYHEQIVNAIASNQFEEGRQLLVEHFHLLPTVTGHKLASE
jgi:DNA-binding FadR family transcriptional regulator